ncbi:hypothetical protein ACLESO_24750 [Pyxidicoccus sp. 3LG]
MGTTEKPYRGDGQTRTDWGRSLLALAYSTHHALMQEAAKRGGTERPLPQTGDEDRDEPEEQAPQPAPIPWTPPTDKLKVIIKLRCGTQLPPKELEELTAQFYAEIIEELPELWSAAQQEHARVSKHASAPREDAWQDSEFPVAKARWAFQSALNRTLASVDSFPYGELPPLDTDGDGGQSPLERALDMAVMRHTSNEEYLDTPHLWRILTEKVRPAFYRLYALSRPHAVMVLEQSCLEEVSTEAWSKVLVARGTCKTADNCQKRITDMKTLGMYRFLLFLFEVESLYEELNQGPELAEARQMPVLPRLSCPAQTAWRCFALAYLTPGVHHAKHAQTRAQDELGLAPVEFKKARDAVALWTLKVLERIPGALKKFEKTGATLVRLLHLSTMDDVPAALRSKGQLASGNIHSAGRST